MYTQGLIFLFLKKECKVEAWRDMAQNCQLKQKWHFPANISCILASPIWTGTTLDLKRGGHFSIQGYRLKKLRGLLQTYALSCLQKGHAAIFNHIKTVCANNQAS